MLLPGTANGMVTLSVTPFTFVPLQSYTIYLHATQVSFYAMSGTDLDRIGLSCYAMSGTDLERIVLSRYAVCDYVAWCYYQEGITGTAQVLTAYRPTHSIRHVRY
eukprot:3941970-Rhodomonas_salina.3